MSWLGRLSVFKMNIPPRVLYPLQMLPNFIPNTLFAKLDKMLSKFLWQESTADNRKITKAKGPRGS